MAACGTEKEGFLSPSGAEAAVMPGAAGWFGVTRLTLEVRNVAGGRDPARGVFRVIPFCNGVRS